MVAPAYRRKQRLHPGDLNGLVWHGSRNLGLGRIAFAKYG